MRGICRDTAKRTPLRPGGQGSVRDPGGQGEVRDPGRWGGQGPGRMRGGQGPGRMGGEIKDLGFSFSTPSEVSIGSV